MALSGALHGGLANISRLPAVCARTVLINRTIMRLIVHVICNDKTVI